MAIDSEHHPGLVSEKASSAEVENGVTGVALDVKINKKLLRRIDWRVMPVVSRVHRTLNLSLTESSSALLTPSSFTTKPSSARRPSSACAGTSGWKAASNTHGLPRYSTLATSSAPTRSHY
jgi:hypothetical protein